MAIKDLSVNAVIHDDDRFPIYDVESGRTRSVLASTIKQYIDDHPSTDKFVQSGSYADGTLTLTYNDSSTINIPGFPDDGLEDHGTLGATQDPRNLAQGTYYVTEKFIDAPDYAPSGYVGLAVVQKGFDQGNGELVAYYNDDGVYYLKKDAAGWDPKWQYIPKAQDTLDSFYLNWDSDGPAYQVGNHVTLTPSRPVPAWADFIGMTYSLDKHTTDNGLASISGNIITLLKVGRIGFTALSRENTASVTGNIDITAASAPGSQPPAPLPAGQAYSATGAYNALNDSKVNDIKFTPNARDKTVSVDLIKNGNTVRADDLDLSSFFSGKIAPTLALHFSGIYDELQDLKDAIPSPTENQQAIVLQPSEKYYHGVGGSWVELAPVGAFHPTYLGAYDSVNDLKVANPSPTDQALAIVGTTAKSFYIYTNSDWEQLTHTDLPSLDARITDLEPKVASNIHRLDVAEGHLQTLQTDVQKNVKDIAELAHVGKTFVYNGSTQPVWDTQAHGNHILTFRAMSQTLQITPPAYTGGNPDGMIITIFNDDIDNAVRFQIPLSTGGSNPNIPPENFASYVYNASTQNYTPMESGYIPVARINLANYIRNQLNSDGYLNTLQEIADDGFVKGMKVSGDAPTALNDMKWLHFNNAVVTEAKPGQADITITGIGNSIDAVVDGTTYKDKHVITFKGMHAVDGSGNQLELSVDPAETVLHFQTIASRDQWSASEGSKYTKVVCVVDRDDNGYVAWYEWDSSKWEDYNAQGVIMSDSTGSAIPKNIKTVVFGPVFSIQQAGDQEDAALVTYAGGAGGIDGITIDGTKYIEFNTGPFLEMNSRTNPDQLTIKPGTFEPMHKPSFLAYVAETEEVSGKSTDAAKGHHDGAIWFGDIIQPAGAYIQTDKPNKAYGLQEADELDPNVSGGTNYLVVLRIAMKGKAPNDGIIRAYLYDKTINPFSETGYLKDVNGQVMGYQRSYKTGEELGVIEVAGVVNAKGLKYFTCHLTDSFVDDMINIEDRTEGGSALMIQAITSEGKTGDGLQQFEIDTKQNIEFSSHYLGVDRASLGWAVSRDMPEQTGNAGAGMTMADGYHFYNISQMKTQIMNGHLMFSDNGLDVADFNFGRIFSAEETQMLRGKTIHVTTTLVDKDSGFEVALMKWTGKPDEYTPEIFTTRNNTIPTFQTGWSKGDSYFISEDVVSGDHTMSKVFTVPSDANNYAIIIYPVAAQQPLTLKLKELKVDVNPAFVGFALKAPELTNEAHLYQDQEYREFVQDNQGYASLRYTINNRQTPMPVGIPVAGKGIADISIDPTINQVSGSGAKGGEGALTFNVDGDASISSEYKVFAGESVPKGVERNVRFWWATYSPGTQQFTEIPDSDVEVKVTGGDAIPMSVTIPSFDIQVEKGEKIAAFAQADIADGAFVQCHDSRSPIVSNHISFKELKAADSSDDPELISAAIPRALAFDRRVYTFSGNSQQNIQIPLTIPADVELAEIEVVKHSGTITTSIKDCEYAYDSSTNTLTVHVGNGVTDGKVYLSFWSGIA